MFLFVMSGVLYFLFVGNPLSSSGVVWDRTILSINQTYCTAVEETPDGGYILIGSSNARGPGGQSAYLVKTNSNGWVQWEKRLGEEYNIKNVVGQVTDKGELIIAGHWRNKVYVTKTDESGNPLWERVLDRDCWTRIFSLTQVPNGGYAVVGYAVNDLYLLKLDDSGKMEWENLLGEGHEKQGYSIQATEDGGFIIAGDCDLTGIGETDVYIAKTDSQGNLEWQKNFGGDEHDHGRSVHVTNDGYIIAGSKINSRENEHEVYLLKTDFNGDFLWEMTYAKATPVMGYDMQVTPDDGYVITGAVSGSDIMPQSEILLMKTSQDGKQEWEKIFSTKSDDFGTCVKVIEDGYLIAGNRDNNIFIMRIRE